MASLSFDIEGGAGHDLLCVDDMGEGSVVLTVADQGRGASVVVSVEQMRAALAGLEGRYD